jgi:hypothetical protein
LGAGNFSKSTPQGRAKRKNKENTTHTSISIKNGLFGFLISVACAVYTALTLFGTTEL